MMMYDDDDDDDAAAATDDDVDIDDDDTGYGRPGKVHLMDKMRRHRGWRENFRYESILRVRGLTRATVEL